MNNKNLPVRVLQIGEGNFLRAFAEYIIETADNAGIFNSSVVISQARGNNKFDSFKAHDYDYHILTRGIENSSVVGKLQKITCVKECINPKENFQELIDTACLDSLKVIISNTTEAGIVYNNGDSYSDFPPVSYPAKLTILLHKRYEKFSGDSEKGLLILPVELIEKNGDNLKEIVLRYAIEWNLSEKFTEWLNKSCCFANTLVDRIVSGFPTENLDEIFKRCGFEDRYLVSCEPFLFWAIECDKRFRSFFPVDKIGLNIVYSDDITPYKTRKVRILNGAHTVSVLAAYLCGHNTVREMMQDKVFRDFINDTLNNEIIPTINLPEDELKNYAASVIERFDNPYIKHKLLDISLNSTSKYTARCLGSVKDYVRLKGCLPERLIFGLAALTCFYRGTLENGKFNAKRGEDIYEIRDGAEVISFFASNPTVGEILANADLWGMNLTEIDGLEKTVSDYIDAIDSEGMYNTVKSFK
jgi:tagaturonate reductase